LENFSERFENAGPRGADIGGRSPRDATDHIHQEIATMDQDPQVTASNRTLYSEWALTQGIPSRVPVKALMPPHVDEEITFTTPDEHRKNGLWWNRQRGALVGRGRTKLSA
jgi:hypothetical protein